MFFIPISEILLLLVVTHILPHICASANPILPNDDDGTLLLNTPAPSPILNHNVSVMVEDNDLQLQCRGGQFGDQLDYTACRDAIRTFTGGNSPLAMEVGRRGMGGYAVGLPWKWVSGNGRCTFDIVLRGPGPSDMTTGEALAGAAARLLDECVRDGDGRGGIVSGVGQAGNLGIIMRSYDPAYIECGSTIQQYTPNDNCAELLASIPAEVAPAIQWGPGGRGLPYLWQLQGNACRLMLWGAEGRHQLSDEMSAFEIWTAGVMLAGVCARFGKAGRFPHLGKNGRLWVLLDDGRAGGEEGVGGGDGDGSEKGE